MFEPVRGGTRGGQAEFKWADVSADKDRENYLGHSINAPTGRWQKNKDIHWYQRELSPTAEEKAEEIRKIKEAEAEALAAALGFATGGKPGLPVAVGGAPTTGPNSIAVVGAGASSPDAPPDPERDLEKEERRRRRAERKEEKRLKKERKEKRRAEREAEEERHGRRHRHRSLSESRSLSPRRRSRERSPPRRPRSRSRTPPARDTRDYDARDYDAMERERERERDRRRWDDNARRGRMSGSRRGRD